ncbi:MAG: alpha/beta hydrolase fold domain-containing protein, partial [Kiritimatiellae bacterium]|nr:alpha/beta hydrolase fold domain-containing protein [Kiritimatiellia bacterium]
KHLSAWQDAQRAIRLVRNRAPSLGLDPARIGAMGFSAGGHLTLMTAVSSQTAAYAPVDEIDKLSCAVQWACPIYPAYVLTDGADSGNKNGGNGDEDVIVPELAFDAATPPMCFVHGDADGYAAMASVKCWERLRAMGIQSDLHTLATRGHCFQFKASDGTGSATWLDQVWDFLTRKGFSKK